MFSSKIASSRNALLPRKELGIFDRYLEIAREETDSDIALVFCEEAEATLSQMKRAVKEAELSQTSADPSLRFDVATAYLRHSNLLQKMGYAERAKVSLTKAEKLGGPGFKGSIDIPPREKSGQVTFKATVPDSIFPTDIRPAALPWTFPQPYCRVADTPQLVSCLSLLKQGSAMLQEDELEPVVRKWLAETEQSEEEKARLEALATELIRTFTKDVIKDKKAVTEVLCLVPVLGEEDFRFLLNQFLNNLVGSPILDINALRGLAQLLQRAPLGHLHAQDLIDILGPVSTRLQTTNSHSPNHIFELTVAVTHVLDAMADIKMTGLKRVELHAPLLEFLCGLQSSSDPHLKFFASYAFQALLCVPNNESSWQATKRRTTKVVKGISGLVSAVKSLDLNGFMAGLQSIQEGMEGISQVVELAKMTFNGVAAVFEGEQDLILSLKEGLTFSRKRAWYAALRGADTLIESGELKRFKTLVCGAVCRRDVAFQWGVCQRLGCIASNLLWGIEIRQGAIAFLGEIYRNDLVWGHFPPIKAYILDILKQLSSSSTYSLSEAEDLLKALATDGVAAKQEAYQSCATTQPSWYILDPGLPEFASPSLLDQVQKKPNVETDLQRLKRQRLKEHGDEAIYISPQAKANLRAPDDALFPLMNRVKEFLGSNQKVMLLLGDSGAGKSTFIQALERDLWGTYEKKQSRIPLFISLPAIDKPERDLIAKQLRRAEFSEPQIRELKLSRKFILICDGYDESQQTHNLYMSNLLNQEGQWKAQMVISCRSEYLSLDHQDQFQPVDRNHQARPSLFQEAVIAPFSREQIQTYIEKYVSTTTPLWSATEYSEALDRIPSLQDLAKNPFMLTLALEVLPRVVDLGETQSAAQLTRVELYDHFVEQWLERSKKRFAEKHSSGEERRAFDLLVKEGFTENGIAFLKDLAVAIYDYQSGNPVVEYKRFVDKGTWKDAFFGRDHEKQVLLEASPLSRSGNQYRFIHKSLLEYCVTRAVFEAREAGSGDGWTSTLHDRRMANSESSLEDEDDDNEVSSPPTRNVLESVLTRINFAGEPSILQFLEERVQLDYAFEKRLFMVIERSAKDKKMRLAVANAVTILNVARPAIKYELPEPDQLITSAPQLRYCLSLFPSPSSSAQALDETESAWLQAKAADDPEWDRLRALAHDMVEDFIRDDQKQETLVAEMVCMTPVLDRNQIEKLIKAFIGSIKIGQLHMLEGLAQLILQATPGHLEASDFVAILRTLSKQLTNAIQSPVQHVYKLTLAVSHILDAAADCHIKCWNRDKLLETFSVYLDELKSSQDPYLVYQAAYSFQALLHASNDEPPIQIAPWHTIRAPQYISGLTSTTKDQNLEHFINGLSCGQGLSGTDMDLSGTAYQEATLLVESGKYFLASIEESFKDKSLWYPLLRGIDTLLQEGQLARSKKLIYRISCRHDPAFQWGVCQRLGDLAGNSLWDEFTRQNAVAFLGELYVDDSQWGQHTTVKQWILNILIQLKTSTENPVKDRVGMLLQELENNSDAAKRALFQLEDGASSYPLSVSLPLPTYSPLLDRIQARPDVEVDLQRLRMERLRDRVDIIYVPPQAKANLQAHATDLFDLMAKAEMFLDYQDQKVLLLLGDSGVGKSTFIMELEYQLWCKYEKKSGRIPLFISLPSIVRPEQDLIAKHLKKIGFAESQIQQLKGRQFVLICDGYDESRQTHNLYTSNRLNQVDEWDAQMVISCRSEYVGPDYKDRFQPTDRNQPSVSRHFQEAVVMPFNRNQIKSYIESFVAQRGSLWSAADYNIALGRIPSLQELVKNPFMLTLLLEVLPRLVDPNQKDFTTAKITRVALYDEFVEQWLERGKKRLYDTELNIQEKKALRSLSDDGFVQNGIEFLKGLATEVYDKQSGNPVIRYSRLEDGESWKDKFFGNGDELELLRRASPFTRNGNQFQFIHRSILEYGLARAVFEPRNRGTIEQKTPELGAMLRRRGSVGSAYSFEIEDSLEDTSDSIAQGSDQGLDDKSPLFRRSFVNESSVLQFLEDRVGLEPIFKDQLFAYVEASKYDKKWRTAAANAITILVRAGVRFNGADLRGIQIPRADISHGQFDSAQLGGADLRKVKLRNVWMRRANLSRAQMADVHFGEWPYLQEDDEVLCCSYSPNGKTCVFGLKDGTISVYDTMTWEKKRTLQGHTGSVMNTIYSPSGHQIASGGQDNTVRLWDAQTGVPGAVLSGHTGDVTSVVYSPSGHEIASGSQDKTVRLWDAQTGVPGLVLSGHTGDVMSVVYSPDGRQIASGSQDKTVRLWDAQTGASGVFLSDYTGASGAALNGHTGDVTSVVYSPSGLEIASGSQDSTVRLWDTQTGVPGAVLSGHTGAVTSIVYSPSGHQIASGSQDKTVRLWDARTGVLDLVLSGHTGDVMSVVYSPNGHQIASGSQDNTVRLWDVQTIAPGPVFSSHTRDVTSIVYSPSGHEIASGSRDKTVRLWDAQTGVPGPVLSGHSRDIASVVYSPNGLQIASGSKDKTVRLWDSRTGVIDLVLSGHSGDVTSVVYSPSGHQIASGSQDKTVRLWDAQTGVSDLVLSGHTEDVTSVVYSPSGHEIASGSQDKTVRLWDAQTGVPGAVLSGHTGDVTSVVYSPGGHQIASGGQDRTVRLWNAQTDVLGLVLRGHTGDVMSVVYSPDGNHIASGSQDKTVRLWDTNSGQCLVVERDFHGPISSIAWKETPRGTYLVTGCWDKSVYTWKIVEEEGNFQLQLHWSSALDRLTVLDASLRETQGLNSVSWRLLQQRGAVGEPESPITLRVLSKKIAMMSAVSKLGQPQNIKMTMGSSPVDSTAQLWDI